MSVELQNFTADELYSMAQDFKIPNRSELNKAELVTEIKSVIGPDPFSDVDEISTGDEVEMNHLSGSLYVNSIEETDKFTEIVLETKRGGRHKLICRKAEPIGKNAEYPHLERWRAGDQEWMNNSTNPTYLKLIAREADINDESVE